MKRRIFSTLLALFLITAVFVLPIVNYRMTYKETSSTESVDKANKNIVSKKTDDEENNESPEITSNANVTYIVTLKDDSLIDAVLASRGKYKSVNELILSEEGKQYCDAIKKNQAIVKASVQQLVSGSDFTGCKTYSAVMNGFTVNAPADAYERLKKINGVEAVTAAVEKDYFFVDENNSSVSGEIPSEVSSEAPQKLFNDEYKDEHKDYEAAYPSTLSGSFRSVISADVIHGEGYTGKGMLIAVIDSEFNVYHSFFSAAPPDTALSRQELNSLYSKAAFNTNSDYDAESFFISSKIAFAYDYAHDNAVTTDQKLEHGTAVAAAAAGNNGKNDIDEYKGIAYDSQLILMKAAKDRDESGRIYAEVPDVIAAIDDSIKLGADVINISFGDMRSSVNKEIYRPVIEKISKIGVYVVCASGNGGFNGSSFTGVEYPYAADIDYGTENYLSGIDGVICVGSTNSIVYEKKYFNAGSREVFYTDISEKNFVDLNDSDNGTVQYIWLDADGSREDYEEADTEGKLVIINKSELEADDVYNVALSYGAAALAVIDNGDGREYLLNSNSGEIPFIIIDSKDALFFQENPGGYAQINKFGRLLSENDKQTTAVNTSYGMALLPQLSSRVLSCGEKVYSASANGGAGYFSGSSIAAAGVSGACALMKQYMNENSAAYTVKMNADSVSSVLLSTSDTLGYGRNAMDEQLYISPRLQGSGVVNIENAFNSGAFITDINNKPFAENIGSSKDGEYEFDFVIHNVSDRDKTYELSYVLQTDRYKSDISGQAVNTLKPYSLASKTEVTITVEDKSVRAVTVRSGDSIRAKVKIKLSEEEKKKLIQHFINGFYVDGYIFVYNREDDVKLNAPFVGFCGDDENIDPFNSVIFDRTDDEVYFENKLFAVAENGSSYSGCELSEKDGEIYFSKNIVRNVLENNSYGSSFILPDFYFTRDVYDLTITVSDSKGSEIFTCNLGDVSAYRDTDSRPYERLTKNSIDLEKKFSVLSDGKYKYKLSAKTMNSDGRFSLPFVREYSLTIESVRPSEIKSRTYSENNRIYLELSAKDNTGISNFILYAASYDQKKKDYSYVDKLSELIDAGYLSEDAYELVDIKNNSDGETVYKYDITDLSLRLVSLKLRTSSWVNKCSTLKIVYKALDKAGNESDAKTADTIIYGSAEFTFTDQNGKPARNITVDLDGIKKTTDKNGKAVFDKIQPGYYMAYFSYNDQLYTLQKDSQLFEINNTAPDYKVEETAEFKGEYIEEDTEEDEQSSGAEEKKLSLGDDELSETEDEENPFYAVVFIGSLLLIGIITLAVRKVKSL